MKMKKMISVFKTGGFSLTSFFWVVGIIVVILLYRKIFSKGGIIGSVVDSITSPFKTPGVDTAEKQGIDSAKSVSYEVKNLTKSTHALLGVANQLHAAMEGFGTDESKMFSALSGLQKDDKIFVYKSFGFREQKDPAGWFVVFKGDLFNWFEAELGGNDLQKMKAVWAVTGLWI